ncbi:MAG TPA: hypothetical protein VGQ95_11020 [Chthoniobacterales bacterium]|nr:hypothetical protein [Chthoniobacterales bacterium]
MTDSSIIGAAIGAIGTVLAAVVAWVLRKREARDSSAPSSSVEPRSGPLPQATKSPSEEAAHTATERKQITDLTHEQIVENIERVPPLQREDIIKHYRGIRVERIGKLQNARRRDDGSLSVALTFLSHGGMIWCDASPEDCPELAFINEGTPLRAVGEIAEVSKYEEKLLDCEITVFRESLPSAKENEVGQSDSHRTEVSHRPLRHSSSQREELEETLYSLVKKQSQDHPTTHIEFAPALKPFIKELRRYEAAGAITGSHALGVDGEFAAGLRIKSAFLVELARLNEDPKEIAKLEEIIECAKGPLNGLELRKSVCLPLTVIDAFFNEYEAQGQGLKSKEIGSSLYIPKPLDDSQPPVRDKEQTNLGTVTVIDDTQKLQEIERLMQTQRIAVIERPTGSSFICVHSFEDLRDGFHRFSFLLPLDQKEKFLSYRSWDKRNEDFKPFVQFAEGFVDGKRERRVYYLQHGNEAGAEALVRTRYYWKNYPAQIEIAEEFRLFWNLYQIHDRSRNVLLHCDTDGTEHEVVRINKSLVEIQLRFLVDYLRAKQMHLAMQLEGNYWSRHPLEKLGLSAGERENTGDFFHWWFNISNKISAEDYQSISLLSGKVIIPCPGDIEYRDPYANDDTTYPEFIVGQDDTGQPIMDAWDEETKGHVNALTPVFFQRAVLRRYFAEPDRYEVSDGELRCSGFWSLRMDNDHPRHIVAWLKDLGQGLPRAEREHWRQYNIPPDGVPSKTFYTRNIRAWFADPEMPDLRLKQLYPRVNKSWMERYGWPLWCEPESEDQYVFQQVHVCLDENQPEFDQQSGLLAKLIVDFLNVATITKELRMDNLPDGSLNRLERFFTNAGFAEAKQQIESLRTIQQLRSAGAAHGKGSNYAAALKRAGLDGLSLVDASMKIFQGAVAFVTWLQVKVLNIQDDGPPPIEP